VTPGPGAPGLIDRRAQNLPVPLGGDAPVREQRSRRRRPIRTHAGSLAAGVGFAAAALGVALLAVPPSTAVSLLGDHVDVGSMVLRETGPVAGSQAVLYSGDASYVLAEHGDGSATASAAWVSSGASASGVCTLRPVESRLIDECSFTLNTERLTSVDVLDPARGPQWQRTYDDGVRAAIAVSPDGAAIPVPFPIGH
jgi:hypothetical protein